MIRYYGTISAKLVAGHPTLWVIKTCLSMNISTCYKALKYDSKTELMSNISRIQYIFKLNINCLYVLFLNDVNSLGGGAESERKTPHSGVDDTKLNPSGMPPPPLSIPNRFDNRQIALGIDKKRPGPGPAGKKLKPAPLKDGE